MDGVIASRMVGIRAVVHGEHGWGMEDPKGRRRKRIWIRRVLSAWIREYTCVSRDIKTWLERSVRVRKPVTRICNAIDTTRYSDEGDSARVRAELGLDPSTFIVGAVGRLDPIKNYGVLLSAFSRFVREQPSSCLLVVGDGPERGRLTQQLPPAVRLLGDRPDVADLLRAFDVFVLPSLNEGISNTILEAMACGVPVIATEVGGNPELVADNVSGLLIPVHDGEAILRALRTYHAHPELRRSHGRAGRRIAETRFSVPSMIQAYEEVWRRVGTAGGRA
jgi:sugar transferase (PEP-CTERM/EpsH1 system associated)